MKSEIGTITTPNADLENIGNLTLELVNRWTRKNGLRVAPQKSELVILNKKRGYRYPNLP